MNAPLFDGLTQSFAVASRRRALKLLAAAIAGGVAVPFARHSGPSIAQEDGTAATPVAEPGAEAPAAEPVGGPTEPIAEPGVCTRFVLSGGTSPDEPLLADDDLTVLLNDEIIFENADGITAVLPPLWFQAEPGDQLTVVARDSQACGRQIGALWLHCVDGGEPRFLTGGVNAGCDPDAAVPENFFRESWRI